MHGLLYDDENNAMFCSSCLGRRGGQECQDTGTIGIQGNNTFATDESRTSKVSDGLVNF